MWSASRYWIRNVSRLTRDIFRVSLACIHIVSREDDAFSPAACKENRQQRSIKQLKFVIPQNMKDSRLGCRGIPNQLGVIPRKPEHFSQQADVRALTALQIAESSVPALPWNSGKSRLSLPITSNGCPFGDELHCQAEYVGPVRPTGKERDRDRGRVDRRTAQTLEGSKVRLELREFGNSSHAPASLSSRSSQIVWPMVMCISCIRGVDLVGTHKQRSHTARILPPVSPVRPMIAALHSRAASIARRIFALLPLVEIARKHIARPGMRVRLRVQTRVHTRNRFQSP